MHTSLSLSPVHQSVRLINHEISEIQRWEASFRSKGKPESPPAILDPSSSPSAQDYNSLALSPKDDKNPSPSSTTGEGGGRSDGSILEPSGSSSSPGGRSSTGDGDLSSSPRLQRSPKRLAGSRYAFLLCVRGMDCASCSGAPYFNKICDTIRWYHSLAI